MGPKELSSMIFMVIANLMGAIYQAYIIGEVAVLIAQVGRKASHQQEIIDTANTAMANIALPKDLREDIREYFKTIMLTMQNQQELDQFFKTISPSLANRVRGHMFYNVLNTQNVIIKETQALIIKNITGSKGNFGDSKKRRGSIAEKPIIIDGQKEADRLLETIVKNLGTSLNLPDEEVIR